MAINGFTTCKTVQLGCIQLNQVTTTAVYANLQNGFFTTFGQLHEQLPRNILQHNNKNTNALIWGPVSFGKRNDAYSIAS